jgi:sigma-B regulation protein RsbU (phosphoserine phosphatase)
MPTAPIGRQEPVNTQAVADAVADVFDATQDLLMEATLDPKAIAERLLDIALEHIPAESGSFFLADVNGHELRFAAVRGPKAKEIEKKKLTVKVGQGIVGFCALEGVCLSVSDIQKDPRYFSAVADAIGYSPKDTLCASAEKEGRLFGALQIINSKGGFTPAHMEVLRYIGLTAASLLERHFDTQ